MYHRKNDHLIAIICSAFVFLRPRALVGRCNNTTRFVLALDYLNCDHGLIDGIPSCLILLAYLSLNFTLCHIRVIST